MTIAGRVPRVVVAPDKFKGSLTATAAAEAIATGLHRGRPDIEVVTVPVADGGDGTVDAALAAGYQTHTVTVTGPTGRPVTATFALRGQHAVLEMAQASGLALLPGGVPAPRTATTRGTGELILRALDAGARHIVLGVGGSATTDGGAGMAQALGVKLLDTSGAELGPGGGALADLAHVDTGGLDPRLTEATVVLASDVDNPLVGPRGAAAVYGPQKGADPEDVAMLDAALRHYAEVVRRTLGVDLAERPGAGAAGGAGAGAMAFLGARFASGADLLLDIVGLAAALERADLVITGEGSLDAQSLSGKAPVGVARAARAAGVPVIALVGRLEVSAHQLTQAGIAAGFALLDLEPDSGRAQSHAAQLLAQLAEQVARSGWVRPGPTVTDVVGRR